MRVLLVEDDELVCMVLFALMDDAGMQVTATHDAGQALGLPDAVGPPTVLVTDVNLGAGMDGFDLADAARRRWPSLGVVLISGRSLDSHKHVLCSSDRFLPKPFEGGRLLQMIQEVTAGAGLG
jgi:DNA-binding response OmpR family regulator